MIASCRAMESMKRSLGYDIDGAVVKADDVALQASVGSGKRFPKWAMAFKFGEDEVETEILDIVVQVSSIWMICE